MKKFTFILCAAIAAMASLTSCNSKRSQMEHVLKQLLIAPSSYHFVSLTESAKVTLADEVEERLEYFRHRAHSDSLSIDTYTSLLATSKSLARTFHSMEDEIKKDEERIEEYRAELAKTLGIIKHLESIDSLYPDKYNQQSFAEYSLTYNAANEYGTRIRYTAVGRFDMLGNLVSIRPDLEESGILIGRVFSIPGY